MTFTAAFSVGPDLERPAMSLGFILLIILIVLLLGGLPTWGHTQLATGRRRRAALDRLPDLPDRRRVPRI